MKLKLREVKSLNDGHTGSKWQDLISDLTLKFIIFWLHCITKESSHDWDVKKTWIYIFSYYSLILHVSHSFQMNRLVFQAPDKRNTIAAYQCITKEYYKHWSASNMKAVELSEGIYFSVNEVFDHQPDCLICFCTFFRTL